MSTIPLNIFYQLRRNERERNMKALWAYNQYTVGPLPDIYNFQSCANTCGNCTKSYSLAPLEGNMVCSSSIDKQSAMSLDGIPKLQYITGDDGKKSYEDCCMHYLATHI